MQMEHPNSIQRNTEIYIFQKLSKYSHYQPLKVSTVTKNELQSADPLMSNQPNLIREIPCGWIQLERL